MLSDGEKRELAEDLRNSANMIRDRGNSSATIYAATIEKLMREAADVLEASLTVPDGDERERLEEVIDTVFLSPWSETQSRCVTNIADAILAAFPALSRDIAGEIEAEADSELPTEDEDSEGWAYLRGLRRAEEIVRNGR